MRTALPKRVFRFNTKQHYKPTAVLVLPSQTSGSCHGRCPWYRSWNCPFLKKKQNIKQQGCRLLETFKSIQSKTNILVLFTFGLLQVFFNPESKWTALTTSAYISYSNHLWSEFTSSLDKQRQRVISVWKDNFLFFTGWGWYPRW